MGLQMDIKGGGNLPILRCRGSHYDVGFSVGSTFKTMIQDLLNSWKYFNQVVLKLGATDTGKGVIANCLQFCNDKYPGYMDEIRGMSKGAEIDFEKLFMLNIDTILCTACEASPEAGTPEVRKNGGTGCTSIFCNKNEVILGHTEDAMAEIKNHVYIVSAEILAADGKTVIENFTTFSYAGTLLGYTMGFNNDGMIYSINTIFSAVNIRGTPRSFIARALLGAKDLTDLLSIVKDKGNGIADGFSLNVCFYQKHEIEGKPKLHNIEIAPPSDGLKESIINVHEILTGNGYKHCNRFIRLTSDEVNPIALKYSDRRAEAIGKYVDPNGAEDIKKILSDKSDINYPLYNGGPEKEEKYEMDFIRTVAVGIFDINKKTWSVYTSPPATGFPIHTLKLDL